jgi:hypothetical protein
MLIVPALNLILLYEIRLCIIESNMMEFTRSIFKSYLFVPFSYCRNLQAKEVVDLPVFHAPCLIFV